MDVTPSTSTSVRRQVDDIFDLTFLLFQGFWALGWSVSVLLLGALAILLAFYSESARLGNGKLIHIPSLGPLHILIDYDLAKVRNVRLEDTAGHPATVQVRFDYDHGANALGHAMPRADGQRIVDAITAAARFLPRAMDARVPEPQLPDSTPRAVHPAVPVPMTSAVALVVANLVPLEGVLFFGWDLGNIMLLYWTDSGVIAFYTAMKIAIVGKLAAIVAVPFFIGHFCGFMTAHFLFIYVLFLRQTGWQPMGATEGLRAIFIPIWGSIAALFISHACFVLHELHRAARIRGRDRTGTDDIAVQPSDGVALHPDSRRVDHPDHRHADGRTLVLLILKPAVDLQAHRNEHRAFRETTRGRRDAGL